MENFNFNRDFYEGCKALGEKDAAALAWALIAYGYDGIEPDGLKPSLKAAFNFARGRVDAMVRGSQGGRARNRAARQGGTQDPSQGGTQDPSQGGTQDPSQGGTQDPSQGTSRGTSRQKEKEKEIKKRPPCGGLEERPAPTEAHPPKSGPESPPTLDEVRVYFAANFLRGDPDAFWGYWDGRDWRDGKGTPIVRWTSLAVKWASDQREIDARQSVRDEIDRRRLERVKPPDEREPAAPMPVAENAVDWHAEAERLEAEGRARGWC